MITIPVNAGSPYKVNIGSGIISTAGSEMKALGLSGKVLIVSDDNVAPLWLDTVRTSLTENGFEVSDFVIPHGEENKNAISLLSILNFAAENNFSRSDTFVALGGGVVGDLCGFAAAVYMRGIGFVQLPTSLLAAVDSSVGGKTAIDLDSGKNLAGAFHQPKLVICDTDCFETLPEEEISNGMGEVIKYGMFCDNELLNMLNGEFDIKEIVARCVAIKAKVVEADEFEKGERAFLNFGHTIAHAIELLSGYTVPHGSAVAAGMVAITKACVEKSICEKEALDILLSLLTKFNLPEKFNFETNEIYNATLKDKKNSNGKITLVLPTAKGKSILKKCDYNELKEFITLGMK